MTQSYYCYPRSLVNRFNRAAISGKHILWPIFYILYPHFLLAPSKCPAEVAVSWNGQHSTHQRLAFLGQLWRQSNSCNNAASCRAFSSPTLKHSYTHTYTYMYILYPFRHYHFSAAQMGKQSNFGKWSSS